MRNAQLGTVYVHSWIQSDLDALSVSVLYIHNVMLAVFICTVLCACVHTFVCMCIHVCHNDMEVCPVDCCPLIVHYGGSTTTRVSGNPADTTILSSKLIL